MVWKIERAEKGLLWQLINDKKSIMFLRKMWQAYAEKRISQMTGRVSNLLPWVSKERMLLLSSMNPAPDFLKALFVSKNSSCVGTYWGRSFFRSLSLSWDDSRPWFWGPRRLFWPADSCDILLPVYLRWKVYILKQGYFLWSFFVSCQNRYRLGTYFILSWCRNDVVKTLRESGSQWLPMKNCVALYYMFAWISKYNSWF